MTLVLAAFGRALRSQLHPRMIGLLVLPFVVTMVFWIVAAIWFFDPVHDWVRSLIVGPDRLPWLVGWTGLIGVQRAGALATALIAVLLLAPLMFVIAMVLVSIVATPIITRHLSRGPYADVTALGRWSVFGGVGTALAALAVFAIGYVVTLPLWLVPFAALIVPWLWWSWLTARILRTDSLAEHATAAEREVLIARHRGGYFVLAMLVTLLNYLPPFFLVTPVLSALAFGHFSLAALRALREDQVLSPGGTVSTAPVLTAPPARVTPGPDDAPPRPGATT